MVAQIFKEVLATSEFRGAFRRIVFAIVDTKGRGNLEPFGRRLRLLDPTFDRSLCLGKQSPAWTPQESPQAARDAYLIGHGSFNPPHKGHVGMFVEAKRFLENHGYSVTFGVMALANARHIKGKGVPALPADTMRLCCEAIAKESDAQWIRCDSEGVNYGSGASMIKGFYKAQNPGAIGFQLVGADVAQKYPTCVESNSVIVGRSGPKSITGKPENRVYAIDGDPRFNEYSSTAVRKAQRAGNEAELVDLVGLGVSAVLRSLSTLP